MDRVLPQVHPRPARLRHTALPVPRGGRSHSGHLPRPRQTAEDLPIRPRSQRCLPQLPDGILRFLAIDRLRDNNRETTSRKRLAEDPTTRANAEKPFPINDWKKSAYEIALRRFLSDPRVQPQTKEIFTRVAIRGEKPEVVATDFGLTRNAVDQIKDRTIRRLKALVAELEKKPK